MSKIFLTMPMHGTSSKYGIPSDHISRWHLVEHYVGAWASSVLPHFAYMSTKILPTKAYESHPLSTICTWAHLPSSRATILAHAINTLTKIMIFCHTPRISWKSCNDFYPWPHFTCPIIMAIQMTTSWDGILLNTPKRLTCSHILHTCPSNYSPQRHMIPNNFEWFGDEWGAFFKHSHICTCIQHPKK